MTLPGINVQFCFSGGRERHTPGNLQTSRSQTCSKPLVTQTRTRQGANPQIATGVSKGRERPQHQRPSIPLLYAGSRREGSRHGVGISSAVLLASWLPRGWEGVSFELLWVFCFSASPPVLWPMG